MIDLDYLRLYEIAGKFRSIFLNNEPFPNIAIDNFLLQDVYSFASENFPLRDNVRVLKKTSNGLRTISKYVTKRDKRKLKDFALGPLRPLFLEFNSGPFIRFLEEISGIQGLIGDPFFREGGFHAIPRGGVLASHTDYSHHEDLGLERRLNFFLYFNEGWKEEWGGHLSLFDIEGKAVQKYLPIANRAVIFATSPTSFHGHPEPLNCPEDRVRKSIALYYYSSPRPDRPKTKIVFQ